MIPNGTVYLRIFAAYQRPGGKGLFQRLSYETKSELGVFKKRAWG